MVATGVGVAGVGGAVGVATTVDIADEASEVDVAVMGVEKLRGEIVDGGRRLTDGVPA